MNVVVPADAVATLFEPGPWLGNTEHARYLASCLPDPEGKPARRFVVHTANIDPTPCETCGSWGGLPDFGSPDNGSLIRCPICDGEGTVPAVVTLTVKCETCEGRRYQTTGDLFSGRDNGPCMTCMTAGYRPVGTATVKHCWPIMPAGAWPQHGKVVEEPVDGVLHLVDVDDLSYTDLTGQVVGTPTPDAWMLELADVQIPVDVYGTSTAPPTTTTPHGGGSAEIVVGVSAAADTPTTNNP